MTKITNPVQKNKRVSFGGNSVHRRVIPPNTRGVYIIVREFMDEPLYKPSAGKILTYEGKKKDTDIVFRRPPTEKPVFTSKEVICNVFKK